jgi:L-ascorbate metabolism protein UlaG (beta-lactamase superfamily)
MKLTWFGHSAFRVEFGAARILIDPFLTGNPSFAGDAKQVSDGCTHVLLTHGHNDHVGDTFEILRKTGAQLIANFEIGEWLAQQLGSDDQINSGNQGGRIDAGGFSVSLVNAVHSSSYRDAQGSTYLGNPLGLIIKAEGQPTLYHLGDTDIFGDMALINEIHRPDIGIVPIGDRYTMGGRTAAMACKRFFQFRAIVPCHYGTFPALDKDAETFLAEMGADSGKVIVPQPGKPFEV